MMDIHPFANIFPLLDGEPFEQLVEDIEEQGLREPILLYDGKILDGRNRYFACAQLGVEPRFEDSSASCDEEAFRESISRNLHRRHLTASQRAMIGAEILPMFEELAKKRQLATLKQHSTDKANWPERSRQAREDAAEAVGASARNVQRAKKVKSWGVEQLVEAVQAGSMSVSTAADVARLDADQQIEVIDLVGEGEKPREALRLVKGAPAALLSSKSNDWYTPSPIVEAARALMGGIDLDPASCAQANEIVKAARFFSIEEDGLSQDWRGRVWLNPPYGREGGESNQGRWSRKLIESFEAGDVSEAVLLVNSVTDRSWFWPFWERSICFVYKRIQFYAPDGRKPQPTHGNVLVYFGHNQIGFYKQFREFGQVLISNGDVMKTASSQEGDEWLLSG